ncbi:MAG: A/G-specific adenine glycosylase [Propionivibrio sp.]
MIQSIDSFSSRLIRWQRQYGRHDLPWQNTRDAYRIWLSEIMLQQTQVATVIPYYRRFLERFPDVTALAAAPIEAVLESWAGLGYYARARNLHRCAQQVVADHGGQFPGDPRLLAELPGIGRSTAAAICVFAHGVRAAILDGNVKRVVARCFGIEGFPGTGKIEKEMWALVDSLLPDCEVEIYTQGLMDLGATVCTRGNPACAACPLHDICVANRDGRQAELPSARPTKILPEREASVMLLTDGHSVLLERRPPTGIWGGLLALPEVVPESAEEFVNARACRLLQTSGLPPLRHTFSHFRLTIQPLLCRVERTGRSTGEPGWEWVAIGEIDSVALPAPIRRLLLQLC